MKPLGTITACFPHVDAETRSILQTVMDEAKDYNEFAEILCNKVIEDDVPELLTYFTYYHVFNQKKINLVQKLEDSISGSVFVKPIVLFLQWGNIEWSEFQQPIALALKAAPNDWIACHVYMTWRHNIEIGSTSDVIYTERLTDLEPLRILESKIEDDEDFSFFRSKLNHIRAGEFLREGNVEETKTWLDRALVIAKKHDCLEHVAALLLAKATIIKNENFNEAMSILKIHRNISEELGLDFELSSNEGMLALMAQQRGEYESAIKHFKQSIKLQESLGPVQRQFLDIQIARQYNQMQDGARALEITTNILQERQTDRVIFYPYIVEAWALVNLERFDEANQRLDLAKDWGLKSGHDLVSFSFYSHFLEGLIYSKRGELPSAKYELEQAYSVDDSFPTNNLTLIHLTDVEIEMFSYKKENTNADVSGPWMQALIDHVEERDIPGIAAQANLLKAKFRFKQGRSSEAKKLVKKVLKTSKTSGMHYLESMAESLIPELLVS